MPSAGSNNRAPLWLVVIAAVIAAVWHYAQSGPSLAPAAASPPAASAPAPAVGGQTPASVATEAVHDLSADEARGGHTLARHVGRTDGQLADRLAREREISAASTYTDRASAERTVARALAAGDARMQRWLARRGGRPNLALDYHGREVVGRSLARGAREAVPCVDALVVLRWTPDGAYVLTSYPEASR